MRIMVTIENVAEQTANLWTGSIAPGSVGRLGTALSNAGGTSVLLVEDAEFDEALERLSFPLGGARVLNLGTSDEAVFVAARLMEHAAPPSSAQAADHRLGFGDRDCVKAFARLPDDLQQAAREIVGHIRALDPNGDLTLKAPRYVNFPDNWVTLQAQPQVREILITFKGAVDTTLKSASARRPYQGFKVRGLDEVAEAKRVLSLAHRRA